VNSRHALGLFVLRAARGSRYETVNSNFKIADYSARLPNRLVLPSPAHLRPVGRLGAITPAPSFFFLRAAHITKLLVQILERLDILSASEPATVGPVGGFFVGGNSRFTGGEDRDRGAIANYGYNARADHGGGWGRNRPNCGYNGRGGPGGGTSRNRPKPE
jgi:hypothetical protein